MAKTHNIWTGFRAGELSPALDGQIEFDKYFQGCKILENFIPTVQGPAFNRPGFRYIASAKNSDKHCRLVPFEYSTEQAYMLEFGEEYIRFYMNQGQIQSVDSYTKLLLSCNGNLYSTSFIDDGVTGHTVTAIGDIRVYDLTKKFGSGAAQLAGTDGYLRVPDHNDFDFSGGQFTIDMWVYCLATGEKCFYFQQTDANNYIALVTNNSIVTGNPIGFTFQIVTGGDSKILMSNSGASLLNRWVHVAVVENVDNWYLFQDGVLVDTQISTDRALNYTGAQVYIGSYNGTSDFFNGYLDEIRISKGVARWISGFTPPINEYLVTEGVPYAKTTTYTETELPELQFAQSADVLFIVHPNHAPAKLSRTGHVNWTLEDVVFIKKYYPSSANISSDFDNFTAANCVDENVGTKAWDNATDIAATTLTMVCSGSKTIELLKIAIYIKDAALGSIFDIEYFDATWKKAYTGWDLTGEGIGWSEIQWDSVGAWTQWRLYKTNGASAGGNVMEIEFYEVGNPAAWTATNYPSCICFFEERLWMANDQTLWASKSADFYNLSMGTNDDDALEYTIGSNQVNKIQWLSSGKILIVGTSGGEYKISASSLDEAITPLNVRIVRQSSYGSAYHECIPVGAVTLFITKSRRKIREFTYSFENDTYVSPDMITLAIHLTRNANITYMAYQQDPNSCIWCIRNDGTLLGFTYLRLEGITAWHRHVTDGTFESVACIPNTIGKGYDEVWVVINRTIEGSTVRYLEMMEKDYEDTTLNSMENFFVDSGLSYNGVPSTVFSGLDHLEGKTVSVLADGVVQTSKVVESGAITLDTEASIVHAGLPYTSTLQTMRIERVDRTGTSQGRIKRINQCVLRLYNTKQFKYGQTPDGTLKEVILDSLFSGDYEVDLATGWDREGHIAIINNQPLPITVVAIIPEVEVN